MGSKAFEVKDVKQDVKKFEDVFGESEAESVLVRTLLRIIPGLGEHKAKRVLDEEISEEELGYFLPLVKDAWRSRETWRMKEAGEISTQAVLGRSVGYQ